MTVSDSNMRLIRQFMARSEENYIFACHASVPLILAPDLLYQLWNNFKQYQYVFEQNKFYRIPHYAVSDLLLSPLCKKVGFELYEMTKEVRDYLLKELVNNIGEKRLNTIAAFLADYAQQHRHSYVRKGIMNIHLLTSKSILNPVEMELQVIQNINDSKTDTEKLNYFLLHKELLPVGFQSDLAEITTQLGEKNDRQLSPILIEERDRDAPDVLQVKVPSTLKGKIQRTSEKKTAKKKEYTIHYTHQLNSETSFDGIEQLLYELMKWWNEPVTSYPIQTIIGKRRSGKTTVLREFFNRISNEPLRGNILVWSFRENSDINAFFKQAFNVFLDTETGDIPSDIVKLQEVLNSESDKNLIILDGLEKAEYQQYDLEGFRNSLGVEDEVDEHILLNFLGVVSSRLGSTRTILSCKFNLDELLKHYGGRCINHDLNIISNFKNEEVLEKPKSKFEYDIFFSYAHEGSLSIGNKDWITEFNKSLEVRLKQLGIRPKVFRETDILSTEFIPARLELVLETTKILICIVTPRYLNSIWGTKEIELFQKAAALTGGILVNNRSRIFKVIKTPLRFETQPAIFLQLKGYDFSDWEWERNLTNNKNFLDKLDLIAHDIAEVITTLDQPKPDVKNIVHVKVFISTSTELKEEREKCISVLNQINKSYPHLFLEPVEWEYDIPQGSYPNFKGVQKAINPLLESCKFCIFIFYPKIGKFTQEEFTLATKLKKKLFVFFKKGFSPKTKDEITKWSELMTFKEGMNDIILYKDYHTITEFELSLKDNLHLYLSQEFSLSTTYENKALSRETTTLLKVLAEKQDEIDELKKGGLSLPDTETKKQLALLEKEHEDLRNELQQSREIQEQQAKEKQELELRLAPQVAKDNLKQKALAAIQENNYDEAETFLKESAKNSIIETASTFYELGKLKKIQLYYKEALHYFELAVRIKPDDFDMNMEAGSMLREAGYNDKAIIHFEKGLQILKPGTWRDESNLSSLYNELGSAYQDKGEYNKAIEYYNKALGIDKKFHGEEHPNFAIRYNNIGKAYRNKGEYDKAIEYYTQALAIDKKFYGEEHPNIATYYNNIGLSYDHKGEYDQALEYYDKALILDKKFHGEEHPDIAADYNNIGEGYRNKGEYNKAIEYYTKALGIDKKFYGEEHPRIATRYNNIGLSYHNKGEYDKAIEYYSKALLIHKKYYGEEHPDIAICYNNLGGAFNSKGEYDKAIKYYEKTLAYYSMLHHSYPQDVLSKNGLARSYSNLGKMHNALGDLNKALYYFLEDVKLTQELYETNPQNVKFTNDLAISYEKLGGIYETMGNLELALKNYIIRNKIGEELHQSFPQDVSFKNGLAISYEKLGGIYETLGNLEEALKYYQHETILFEELFKSYPQYVSFKDGLTISRERLKRIYKMTRVSEIKNEVNTKENIEKETLLSGYKHKIDKVDSFIAEPFSVKSINIKQNFVLKFKLKSQNKSTRYGIAWNYKNDNNFLLFTIHTTSSGYFSIGVGNNSTYKPWTRFKEGKISLNKRGSIDILQINKNNRNLIFIINDAEVWRTVDYELKSNKFAFFVADTSEAELLSYTSSSKRLS